jgi:hypothetical protein
VRESPWRTHITAGDYERHMAATGQPQANGDLLAELFRDHPPAPGAAVLFAGAGTGQIFDYFPPAMLAEYRVTSSDINPAYLTRLAARFQCDVAIDNIESPALRGPFDLAIVILVLEHVEWRRAVAGMCGAAARVFVIIQENPEGLPSRPLAGTMAVLQDLPASLVDRAELIAEFAGLAFDLARVSTRVVRDGKKMVALDFTRRRSRCGVP